MLAGWLEERNICNQTYLLALKSYNPVIVDYLTIFHLKKIILVTNTVLPKNKKWKSSRK